MMSALVPTGGLCGTGTCHRSRAWTCEDLDPRATSGLEGEHVSGEYRARAGEASPPCSHSRRSPRKGGAGGVRTRGPTGVPRRASAAAAPSRRTRALKAELTVAGGPR